VCEALANATRSHGLPQEILTDNGKVFESISDAQAQLDGWVHEYNHDRRHQGIGDVVPWERFRLAASEPAVPVVSTEEPTTTRKVGRTGKISFAAVLYPVGVWLDGKTVDVSVADGLVSMAESWGCERDHLRRHYCVDRSGAGPSAPG
jgi:NAD-dependent DNA ligase